MPTFVTILQKDVRTGAFVRVSSSGRCVNIPGSLLHSQSESRNLRLCADPVIPPCAELGAAELFLTGRALPGLAFELVTLPARTLQPSHTSFTGSNL